MGDIFVDKIFELLPPPQHTNYPPVDWCMAEAVFGVPFPTDFKRLVDVYGSCQWCDIFRLLRPDTESEAACRRARDEVIETLHAIFDGNIYNHDGDVIHLKPYPEKGGVFPCIGDSNGDYFCWVTDGDPEEWSVARFSIGVFSPFNCGVGELVWTWLTRQPPGKDAWSEDFLRDETFGVEC